ncbi:hypothetical protein IE81DRAFT_27792 [Ceraceosorus guamensis]|uniref:phosphoinositide 5-phosphatase n=1 Tax=Ceraceosorus guamensis TaxID=1522189 RepID=A0A316W3Y9_9BASI|nr:hypothetical protein IE81DRAFT_27792 [Ceraceosorus guamensis]PWN44254.1 hypothetical protein IE81DRAFT_27792 [Ceraceosorus guamensis]
MQVHIRKSPRAVILSSSGTGAAQHGATQQDAVSLVISMASAGSSAPTGSTRAVIELLPTSNLGLSDSRRVTPAGRPAHGCLGLMNVGPDVFAVIVVRSIKVGSVRPGEEVSRISAVSFVCINRASWDDILDPSMTEGGSFDPYAGESSYTTTNTSTVAVREEHPCTSLRKLLSTGSFYYAEKNAFDLSRRLDRRCRLRKAANSEGGKRPFKFPSADRQRNKQASSLTNSDARFVWNTYMAEPLLHFRAGLDPGEQDRLDRAGFLLLVIQGFVATFEWPASGTQSHKPYGSTMPGPGSGSSIDAFGPNAVGSAASSSSQSGTTLALISRLSSKRAGTRFNTRGIDDDGNVANFVESETLFTHESVTVSYTQVRGSPPMFWEQQGLQTFNARIQITRPRVASQPAFDRHFVDLLSQYKAVHAINLLGTRDAETILSGAYAEHMRHTLAPTLAESMRSARHGASAHQVDEKSGFGSDSESSEPDSRDDDGSDLDKLGLTNFDFHATSRLHGGLDGVRSELKYLGPVQLKKQAFGFTVVVEGGEQEGVYRQQAGLFRVNCLDCLDRTNVVQDMLSQSALETFFERASKHSAAFEPFVPSGHPIWSTHRIMWAENGDALSKIYAGTGALNTSYTRAGSGKKTLGGFLSDAAKSAGRMYINNFQDKSKQSVIDALLGNLANQKPVSVYDPLNDSVSAELQDRLDEYSSTRELDIFVGTWNLAGRAPMGESLLPWLFPQGQGEASKEADIIALGFQEVVPLTPQQILMTDPDKIRVWESVLVDALHKRPNKRGDYILLRSEQLVGSALVIFVKDTLVDSVRQVEAASRKTGLKGMSGNKGGVAIRLNLWDTSLCFITAHLAAGSSNVEERNADYHTILRGLAFQKGRSVASHDHVFWAGDFNYRIDLPNETARPLCAQQDFAQLYARDQLDRARASGSAFGGYEEGEVRFLPTYKYDFGSTLYDTSEKQRVPAWTDRILFRAARPGSLTQTSYSRAELKTSDHRPVYASFKAEARVFDHDRRNAIRRNLLAAGKSAQARSGGLAHQLPHLGSSSEEDSGDQLDLPPPSDEHSNWWDTASSEDELDPSSDGSSAGSAHGNPFVNADREKPQWHQPSQGLATPYRRPPPRPPKRGDTIRAKSNSTSSRSVPAPSPERRRAFDATLLPKATSVAARAKMFEGSAPFEPQWDADGVTEADDRQSAAHQTAAAKPGPPPVPIRPGMGSRTASYSSVRSGKSLMDSDSDQESASHALGDVLKPGQ